MLSFVLAVALWLYVTGKEEAPIIYDYPALLPVAFHGLNSNYVVNGSPPDVRLRIQLQSNAPYFYGGSFQPFVDLAGYRPGFYRIPVQVQKDPGITVAQVVPQDVPVRIEALKVAPVPVEAKVEHRVPGYLSNVTVQPNVVRVSGPASVVAQVRRAVVNVSLTTYNFSGAYTPLLVNGQGQPVPGASTQNSPQPAQVQVTVQVKPPASSKTVPVVVPNLRGRPRAGYGVVALEVQPAQILAQGSADKLAHLTSVSTSPISISRRGSGTFSVNAYLRLPKGVRSRVQTVRITARLAPVDTSTTVSVGVTPENVGYGLIASIKPATVAVTVVGPASSVKEIADKLRATINLFGYGTGTFSNVQPQFAAPPHYQVTSFYPSGVLVTISGR